MKVTQKIDSLRELMKEHGLVAYLIDNADNHGSEYVNDYYKERTFISGFDGSNGKVLVTLDNAYLWTDGRYFLQAEKDLEGTGIELMKMGMPGVPQLHEFIVNNFEGKVIGINGETVSTKFVEFISSKVKVNENLDLVNEVWKERGKLTTTLIYPLSTKLTGESTAHKLERINSKLGELGASSLVSTNIDDIAWTFNLRGSDVSITPVFLSFAYISKEKAILFVNLEVLNNKARASLKRAKVEYRDYSSFLPFLKELKGEKILFDKSTSNYAYYSAIKDNNTLIDEKNPVVLFKAIKNKIEIRNNISIHKEDGLAIFRFMKFVKENYGKMPLDEYYLAEKALEFRKRSPRFNNVSFESISSWNENGAIIHYEPTKESSKKVEGTGFLLLDSGGQYTGGTTDITRTYKLGRISNQMKHHYTMVLKSFIDVSMAHFHEGATGQNIDMLARAPFWKEGLDYRHGTGHGVGYMLNVHESPNGFRWQRVIERNDSASIVPGMITTIEPGIYLSNQYGIRTENELLTVPYKETEYGKFFAFKPITYAPIDLDPVIKEELTKEEIEWLNNYHKNVYNVLSKMCEPNELKYLKKVTRSI